MQELGIKHPLHRKKLQLALQALGSEEDDNKGKLDYHWVTSEQWMFICLQCHGVILDVDRVQTNTSFFFCVLGWLDDIGLPQYKTQFDEGRVDGRMLHYMTVVSFTTTEKIRNNFKIIFIIYRYVFR